MIVLVIALRLNATIAWYDNLLADKIFYNYDNAVFIAYYLFFLENIYCASDSAFLISHRLLDVYFTLLSFTLSRRWYVLLVDLCMICKCQTTISHGRVLLHTPYTLSLFGSYLFVLPIFSRRGHFIVCIHFDLFIENYLNSTFTTFSGSKLRCAHNLLTGRIIYTNTLFLCSFCQNINE